MVNEREREEREREVGLSNLEFGLSELGRSGIRVVPVDVDAV